MIITYPPHRFSELLRGASAVPASSDIAHTLAGTKQGLSKQSSHAEREETDLDGDGIFREADGMAGAGTQ